MRRFLYIFFAFLVVCSPAFAQSTTVSGTVTDGGGQTWNSGTYTFVFVPNPAYPNASQYTWTGGTLPLNISGTLSGSGGYSQSVPSSTSISPIGSTWRLQVCPLASAPCFNVIPNTAITGGTQTLNAAPPAIQINLSSPPGPFTRAYSTSEIISAPLGGQFYLIGTGLQTCTAVSGSACVTWTNTGGAATTVNGTNVTITETTGNANSTIGPGHNYSATGETNAASQTLNMPQAITAGNAVVCSLTWINTTSTASISDTLGSSWVSAGTAANAGNVTVQMWVTYNSVGGNDTITFTLNVGTSQYGSCVEIWGALNTAALDVTATGTGTSGTTSVTTSAATPTVTGDLAICAVGLDASAAGKTFQPGTGWNGIGAGPYGFLESINVSGATQACAATLGTSGQTWAALLLTLKAGSGAPPSTPFVQANYSSAPQFLITSNSTEGSGVSCTTPCVAQSFLNPNLAGDTILVWFEWTTTPTALTSITDSAGNTYTHVPGYPVNISSNLEDDMWYATNIVGASNNKVTATLNFATVGPAYMQIEEFSGTATVNVLDATSNVNHQTTGTAPVTQTGVPITTTNASDILVAIVDSANNVWNLPSSGWYSDFTCAGCAQWNGGGLPGQGYLAHTLLNAAGGVTGTNIDQNVNNPTYSFYTFAFKASSPTSTLPNGFFINSPTGSPILSIVPIGGITTITGNSVYHQSSDSYSGSVTAKNLVANQGPPCTNAELALSAGWQSTGSATVTAVQGAGQTCSWTITTGTTTAAAPTVTDTLTSALPSSGIVCEMIIHGGTHTAAAGEGFTQTTISATAPVFTFIGTPTAGGTTYFVTRRCGP